ncbi:glycosyl hydrolase family 18 protein [Anaerolentibacter hominis]|uniref:glycosyl hydrolase family 18 protein n=1 Tax=Anaerolentibacter hominis TaxID=3079009 RepID=UPI0031B83643
MRIYIVEAGDTLTSIAASHQTTVETLIYANGMPNPDHLVVGQSIVIPESANPSRSAIVNGYAYPYINHEVLRAALPYLTTLSLFSYGFRRDGSLIPIEDDELIALARTFGVQSVMMLSTITEYGSFSSDSIYYILTHPESRTVLFDNILQVMEQKGYAGLDIDFEYIDPAYEESYLDFISYAVSRLHPYGFFVHVDLAPKTSADQPGLLYEAHNYREIGERADMVLLMTYEWGYTYGPPMAVAPINQVRRVLEYGVSEIPPSKILMGIPNYGYDWALPYIRGESRAFSIGNEEALSIAAEHNAVIEFDPAAMSPYFYYSDGNGTPHVVWFEDARSIQAKYELIHEFQVLGPSYWNIMRPFRQNWTILSEMFGIDKG